MQSEQKRCPDVILSDIMMPDVDGYAFAYKLKEQKIYQRIKLIALSSHIGIGSAREAQQSGFDGFLPKPIFKKELIKIMCTVLGDHRDHGQIVTRHMAEELSCKGVRILVVEDVIPNQQLMKAFLELLGCVADFADNGQQALEKLHVQKFDLCFMDLQMPVMGGLEATQIIRKEISQDLPIVALTAASMKEDQERCLAAGMNDVVIKPVDLNKLKEKIKFFVKRKIA
jgi:CheY-like chemotaxis protein